MSNAEGLLSESQLDEATFDELAQTIEDCKTARTALREANREKVRELKAQMGELQQRRSRKGSAEPTSAEDKPKKKKKRQRKVE